MADKSNQVGATGLGKPSPFIETSENHGSGAVRSLLRNGTALDNLRPDRPLMNSVLARSDLPPIKPPPQPSAAYAKCDNIKRRLLNMVKTADRAKAHDFPDVIAKQLAPYFGPKSSGTFGPTLPHHPPYDPIDPVVILKEAVPLVHGVLLQDPDGNDGLDLDGMAYIIERLAEAKQLQGLESDIRFAVLEALSHFLSTVLAKASQEELA